MSKGLVSGMSGIIAAPNLASNGGFNINQREGTSGVLAPRSDGDYISDMWQLASSVSTIKTQNLVTSGGNGSLEVIGEGKKGQFVEIQNRYLSGYGNHWNGVDGLVDFTSSVMLTVGSTSTPSNFSVPLEIEVRPPRNGSSRFDGRVLAKNGQVVNPVSIYSSALGIISSKGMIRLVLQEDGLFRVNIRNYAVISGAYKNPPSVVPVHYAYDLARCQRYYQKGELGLQALGADYQGTNYRLGSSILFQQSMATAPTVVGSNISVKEEGSATEQEGNYTVSFLDVTNSGVQTFYVDKALAGSKPSQVSLDWTAEVV